MVQDPPCLSGEVEFPLRPKSEFRYREILPCIQYLLRQRAFVKNMVWAPVKVFVNDEREYSEMNTGTWWWDQQVCYSLRRMITCLRRAVHAPRRFYPCSCSPGVGPDPPDKFLRR